MHLPLPEKQQKKRKDMSNASWKQGIMYLQRLLSHTIWKSLKKYHFTRFDKKLLPAFRGTLTTYLASTFPFHNSFISYDSTCTSWDQIDTFDIKFSKSSKILLRHFWWFSNTAWEQAKEEWEEERRGGEGGRGSKVCKLAKMRVVAFSSYSSVCHAVLEIEGQEKRLLMPFGKKSAHFKGFTRPSTTTITVGGGWVCHTTVEAAQLV